MKIKVRIHNADIGNLGRVELKDRSHITSDRLDLKYERTYDISSTQVEVIEHNKFSSSRAEHPNVCGKRDKTRIATVGMKVKFVLTRPAQRIFVPLKTL